MNLLVLKVNGSYLRILESGYELTGMDKASVYPEKEKEKVLKLFQGLKNELTELTIKKLTIKEEPL